MSGTTCPSPERLAAYLVDELDEQEATAVERHLVSCPTCETRAVVLEAGDDAWLTGLRGAATVDGFAAEPECQAALAATGAMPLLKKKGANARGAGPVEPAVLERVGPYRLLEPIGQGGMGAVYRAWHERLKRPVAIKLLARHRQLDAHALDRFHREMEVVGRLDHPHIVRAIDAGDDQGIHFLVMEFVDGLDLRQIVRRRGPLPIREACEVARQAALGLQHVHEHDLVHRDVKPSNLMLNAQGQVKLLDMGLARLHEPGDAILTGEGELMGTYDYMAPEQGRDSHHVDIRADLYSLGATLYMLLAGQPPFGGLSYNTLVKKMAALAREQPAPLSDRRPAAPPALQAILDRLLAKEPDQRFATPQAVAEALAPFAAGANLAGLLSSLVAQSAAESAGPVPHTDSHRSSAMVDASSTLDSDAPAPLAQVPGGRVGGEGPCDRRS
jgi:serine/threonine protein kinase